MLRISARRGMPSFSTKAMQPTLSVSGVALPFSLGSLLPTVASPFTACGLIMEIDATRPGFDEMGSAGDGRDRSMGDAEGHKQWGIFAGAKIKSYRPAGRL